MNYPNNPMVDDNVKHKPEIIKALWAFKRKKPWRDGRKSEYRLECMRELINDFSAIYEIDAPRLEWVDSVSNNGQFNMRTNVITIFGELSTITLLHEFAHAKFGRCERKAVKWSINLFRKVFPKQFEKLMERGSNGHMLHFTGGRNG